MSGIPCQYSEFWLQFQKVVTQLPQACQCYPQAGLWREPLGRGGDGKYEVALQQPILLKNLPCSSISGHLDVIIDYKECFLTSSYQTIPVETSISVHYFLRSTGNNHTTTRLHSLRFDFHPSVGGKDGDPITHAHIESDELPRKLPEAYRKMKIDNSPVGDKALFTILSYGRMPTPRLPLPGVLCLLAADHYRREVLTVIDRTQGALANISPPSVYAAWHKKSEFQKRSDAVGWAWYIY